MKKFSILLLLPFVSICTNLLGQIDARMLRQPDVSASQIVFVYAGDIWVVPKSGGVAQRLSSPEGEEQLPRFSPDGTQISFSANYDGNGDVYVVSNTGGLPTRLTHHPMNDRNLNWYPDGESILFASSRESGRQRFNQFYKVSRDGGMPEKLPVPFGEFGAVSPDGKKLAYIQRSRDFRTWKRYRGGWAPDIWIFDLETFESENITSSSANDSHPMWHGDSVYFLSDRGANKRYNIWKYDLGSEEMSQITDFSDFDIHFPAIGPSDIVFEAGGRLHLLDLETDRYDEVKIQVVTDKRTLKPRMENVSKLISNGWISPTGKRAVFEARGEVFSVPAEHGPIRNLTKHSSGSAERYPTWSPDGKYIAYWSDSSGEYQLTIRQANGSGQEETLTSFGPGFRYRPYWSPDSKKIAFIDQSMQIKFVDRETGEVKDIDKALYMFHGSLSNFGVSWSSDSRWLAYARDTDARTRAIFVYDSETGETHQMTSGYYDSSDPVFDPNGKYLFFLTSRNFSPSYSDFDNSFVYSNSTQIAAVGLKVDEPSPLATRNDEESVKEEEKDEPEKEDNGEESPESGEKESEENGSESEEQSEPAAEESEAEAEDEEDKDAEGSKGDEEKKVEIDFEGFERRIVILPPAPGNYRGLAVASGKVLFLKAPRTGADPKAKSSLVYYDLKEREEKEVLAGINGYLLSADGKKILVRQQGKFGIIDLKPGQKLTKPLRTGEIETLVDPKAEWKQIFADAWRFERDFFYDPNMHGVDWEAMRVRYGALINDAVTRWDVNYVLGELIAELNASHTYRGGGDAESASRRGVGMLGIDWELADGAYRIKQIVRGAPWDNGVRSPLDVPGVKVSEGDYILAVNGVPLDTSKDPWAAFEGLNGKAVLLSVNESPEMEGAREVLIETMPSETRLRHLQWIEANRKRVEEATNGRVGYIYVRSTGIDGQSELVRQFYPQFNKEGLIIDERFNSGGQIPDRFIELLNRDPLSFWAVRDGRDWQWPPVAHFGPKVMLINGWSGSGGDAFPYYFRESGLGPLIGTTTWGGLIGISGAPSLVDGGVVTVPTFRMFGTKGDWFEEGRGVTPDIEVIEDPSAMAKGIDPQLERAIEEVLKALESGPDSLPNRPAYEDRSK